MGSGVQGRLPHHKETSPHDLEKSRAHAFHCISLHFIAFLHLLNVQTSANKPFRSTPGRTYVSGEDWRKELLLLDLLAVRGRDRAPRNIKIISKCPRFMVIMTGFFPTVVADFQATAHLEMYWQWS